MAYQIGVTRPPFLYRPRPWRSRDDGILLELYGTLRPEELADELNRTAGAIHHRAEELGLRSRRCSPEFRRRQSLPRKGRAFTGLENPALAGYVAGIIDGEGSILAPPRVTISVSTTTKPLALRLEAIVGGTVAGPYLYAKHKRFGDRICRVKPQYHWNFASQYHVYLLLERVRKYLVVKRREADRGIRYFEDNLKWRVR